MTSFKAQRLDGFTITFTACWICTLLLGAWANWPTSADVDVILIGMGVMGLATAYMIGPVAYIRLHFDCLIVGNAFMQHIIPLHAIRGVGGYDNLGVDVELGDGRKIPVRAFEPSASPLTRSYRAYRTKGKQLENALESLSAVPQAGSGSKYARKIRLDSLLATVAIVMSPLVAIIVGLRGM